ncbi:outer membrane lipid asymmetry maintenance protein MlaD [Verticiella sediminum]|uniref:Outer membrane lipid asymmetry maintenance protein MlaD n=1 Tax=Verticiella sediminum TaxID=1247510 RepID=A0A556A862_9BURK|nr:outer membrane lipid asymmetry maintenance protein MlaD [Verticiella sediminum]TSH89071.1 outer membrane lipid asymmetry maintenance protein MlaD [Verticiella sediminum]
MGRSKVDFWVGLFVLFGIVALVFLALRAGNLGSISTGPSYSVSANFNNVGGLKPRAAVRSAGVVVGRVESIQFDDQAYQAVVTMRINQGVEFPSDSSASILTSGLLGEQYIGLDPGAEDKMLAAGDRITYTQGAVVLENLISRFLYGMANNQGTSQQQSGADAAGASPPAQQ